MRDLTKSVTSCAWAMSAFGIQQIVNLLGLGGRGSWERSTKSFTNLTETASHELGDTMRGIFRSGDTLQRSTVDLVMAPFSPENGGGSGSRDGASRSGGARGNSERHDGGLGAGWVETAARAAAAGVDAIQAAVDTTAQVSRRMADTDTRAERSAPSASDPSLGWGPTPR